jgi:hypothetical protein
MKADAVQSAFRAAIKDGHVSRKDVMRIFGVATKGGEIDRATHQVLTDAFEKHQTRFSQVSRSEFERRLSDLPVPTRYSGELRSFDIHTNHGVIGAGLGIPTEIGENFALTAFEAAAALGFKLDGGYRSLKDVRTQDGRRAADLPLHKLSIHTGHGTTGIALHAEDAQTALTAAVAAAKVVGAQGALFGGLKAITVDGAHGATLSMTDLPMHTVQHKTGTGVASLAIPAVDAARAELAVAAAARILRL